MLQSNSLLPNRDISPCVLLAYDCQLTGFDEGFQLGQCGITATLAYALKLGALDALMGGEELREAFLDDGVGELLGTRGASAHDDGSAHRMLQLGAGAKDDAVYLDVLARDVILLALVLTGEREAEGAYVVYLHAVTVEQSFTDALAHGLQHGQHIRLGDATGVVDVFGYLSGGYNFATHDAHRHRGVLLRGLALQVVSHMELVGNGTRLLGCASSFHL